MLQPKRSVHQWRKSNELKKKIKRVGNKEMFETINVYVALAINGIFSGIGAATGTYIAQAHIIRGARRVVRRLRRKVK